LNEDVQTLLGVPLNAGQIAAFKAYERELLEWNQRFNLTSITDPAQIRTKHFLDSLSCWLAMRENPPGRMVDVGAGAGFPGLPLKILQPQLELTLVESTAKKAGFIEHIVQVLGLRNVTVLAKRAEDVGHMAEHRAAYDWVVARALAPMPVLAEYLLPLAKIGGGVVAQKGKDASAEVAAADAAISKLGGQVGELLKVDVPGLDVERWVVVFKKLEPTLVVYPRRAGMPSKRPL
jgi:16S rRNA (guanine527-N7)-methyltransferase